jgi:hypothetical protein
MIFVLNCMDLFGQLRKCWPLQRVPDADYEAIEAVVAL